MREYGGWPAAEVKGFQGMLRRALYPLLSPPSRWNGNVDLTQIAALLSVAVFNEDGALFRAALRRLDVRTPAYCPGPPGAVKRP